MSKERMLKKGDKVVMHTCGESTFPKYYGKVWTCKTDEYITGEGKGLYEQRLVFLDGFSGSFATDYLQYIDLGEMQKVLGDLKQMMQAGHKHGYEAETVFWTRCIWEIDQVLEGEHQ